MPSPSPATRCQRCSAVFQGEECPACGWKIGQSSAPPPNRIPTTPELRRSGGANTAKGNTNPQLPRATGAAQGGSTGTPSSPSVELLEWRPRGSTGEFQKAQAAASAAAPPPTSPAKTSKPPRKGKRSRLPWIELGGLAIALVGFGILYRLYRPPTTPPISDLDSKGRKTLVVPKKVSTPEAPKSDTLAPGVFVVRSPGTGLNVKIDGTGTQEEMTLAGTTGEMVVSSASPPWSLKMSYERATNGLTLTIQPIPPMEIRQSSDNTVLARRGEVAHVHVGRRPVQLQMSNADGPRILMQYRGAGSE